MKKTLLTIVAVSIVTFTSAQTTITQNFNSLSVGNIGTDITGSTAGQGGYGTQSSNGAVGTTSTNAGNSNFQVVAQGGTYGNVLQLTGPDGNAGFRYMYDFAANDVWTAKPMGNDIIEIEWNFYTGPATTSKNTMQGVLFDTGGSKILVGLTLAMDTKIISALAYYDNNGTKGTYQFTLKAGGLVLQASTWYKFGISFNATTGKVTVKGDNVFAVAIPGAGAGLVPNDFDFAATAGTGNTTAAIGLFDNLVLRTSDTDTLLLGVGDEPTKLTGAISIFPNPATDVVNVTGTALTNVSIVDINGRSVKSQTVNANKTSVNISDLSTGVYMMTVQTADGKSTTKKLLKK